jgi:hypothetical protein
VQGYDLFEVNLVPEDSVGQQWVRPVAGLVLSTLSKIGLVSRAMVPCEAPAAAISTNDPARCGA